MCRSGERLDASPGSGLPMTTSSAGECGLAQWIAASSTSRSKGVPPCSSACSARRSTGSPANYQLGRQLMTPTLTARLATESVRRFDADGNELEAEETREALGFLGVERTFEPGWQVALGVSGHDWHEPGRDLATLGATATVLKASRSGGQVFKTELLWTGVYQRAALDGEAVLSVGGLRLRPRIRLGWGDRLPLQATFPWAATMAFRGFTSVSVAEIGRCSSAC